MYNGRSKYALSVNSLGVKKQKAKFTSANLKKNIKSKLYHIENSKT